MSRVFQIPQGWFWVLDPDERRCWFPGQFGRMTTDNDSAPKARVLRRYSINLLHRMAA